MRQTSNSWGKIWLRLALPLVMALAASVSCGGGGSAPVPDNSGNPPAGEDSPQAPIFRPLDDKSRPLGAPLPSLASLSGSRGISAAAAEWPGGDWPSEFADEGWSSGGGFRFDATGPQLLAMAGGSLEDGYLHLRSDADNPAWAVFRVPGLGSMDIGGLGFNGAGSGSAQSYYMGAGDFSDGEWDFSDSSGEEDYDWEFGGGSGDYADESGDGYFCVVVPEGGQSCCCDSYDVFADDEDGGYEDDGDDLGYGDGYDDGGFEDPCSGEGEISSLDATSIVLDGIGTWEITEETEFILADGGEGSAAQFAAGDYVFIAGEPCADEGSGEDDCCDAIAVFQYDPSHDYAEGAGGEDSYWDGDYSYAEGTLDAIGGGAITVDGEELSYNEETTWYTLDDEEGAESDFHTGDYIGILVKDNGDGFLVVEAYNYGDADNDYGDDYSDGGYDDNADEGDYDDGSDDGSYDEGTDDGDYREFSGALESIGSGTLVVSGQTFTFDESTLFVDAEGNEVDSSSIHLGATVYIEAYDDGSGLYADYVEVESAYWE